MKKFPALCAALAALLAISCGPSKHAIHVEMRHPSKTGVDLAGRNVSVVYLENDNAISTDFSESMADGFAYALEQDYGQATRIGIYRMRQVAGADYSRRDSLFNILMDTDADVVFLFDTVRFGTLTVGGPSRVTYPASKDSSYVSTGSIPFTMKLYCYDGMGKEDKVQTYGGNSVARPEAYSNGKDDSTVATSKAWKALGEEGWDAGLLVADSFKSQWKHEQYSIVYYDSEKWYKALEKAEQYDWKGAMDIWLELLDTHDLMKRACAEFDIAVACYMLGDYQLASQWLDLSDKDNKLPISDAMRKRIDARKR
ncbi:MAG: tetratricopeptide repeat protein [Bacteroidales bacterium]|nr:tetratricopeptide repeat protein [Bacteroidales bacterium]